MAGFTHVGRNPRRLAEIVHFHRPAGRDFWCDLSGRTSIFIDEPDACRFPESGRLLGSRSRAGQARRRFDRNNLATATGRQREATSAASRRIEQGAFSAAGQSGQSNACAIGKRSRADACRERSRAIAGDSPLTARSRHARHGSEQHPAAERNDRTIACAGCPQGSAARLQCRAGCLGYDVGRCLGRPTRLQEMPGLPFHRSRQGHARPVARRCHRPQGGYGGCRDSIRYGPRSAKRCGFSLASVDRTSHRRSTSSARSSTRSTCLAA